MTDAELDPTPKLRDHLCPGMKCGRCAVICPTQAIPLAARKDAAITEYRRLDKRACASGAEVAGAATVGSYLSGVASEVTDTDVLYSHLLRLAHDAPLSIERVELSSGHTAVAFLRDDEFRVYLFLLAAASVIALIEVASEGIASGETAVRQAVFNTVSIFSTTGYANSDFNEWTAATTFVLVGGMLVSASAGSTGWVRPDFRPPASWCASQMRTLRKRSPTKSTAWRLPIHGSSCKNTPLTG